MAEKISINTQIYSTRLGELNNKTKSLEDKVGACPRAQMHDTTLVSFSAYITTHKMILSTIQKYAELCKTDMRQLQSLLDTFIEADRT